MTAHIAPAASPTPFVSTPPASTWAAIYLGVAAATLPAVLPVMVGVFADRFGYGVAGAGTIAALNMGGILIGSLLCPLITARFGWGGVVRAALAVMIAGNLLTMLDGHYGYVAATRFLSGLGEGVVGGICYAAMGRSARPERSISIYFAGQSIVGMVGMGSFGWIAASLGWPWIFLILSAITLPGFWLASVIGRAQPAPAGPRQGRLSINPLVIGALACILLYFIGMASLWPFLERIGIGKGLSPGTVAFALSVSAFGGLAGSLVASVVAGRLPRTIGLLSGLCLLVAGVGGLAFLPGTTPFIISVSLFAFAWPFQYAFQFGQLASVDRGGRLIALTPAVTGGGLALGPAIGGLLLQNLSLGAVSAFCLLCVVVAVAGTLSLRPRSVD
ncbi:MAG: MFS transporter [Sphingopyxis sp.]|nr:MFS transporter [Sphingopyxis sp.]